jgi:uracil-DNA glycosylase
MSITIDEIKKKILHKLEKSGWDKPLYDFIISKDFENIINSLYKESRDGNKFTPLLKDIFKAFELCPYNELKVVIVAQDPYPGKGIADGIAFSCSHTRNKQPSLKYLLDEINHTLYDDNSVSTDPDLSRWCEQGVLMLNVALTTTVNKVGQHYLLWRPFLAYLFDVLNWNNSGIIYLYMGKKAQEWSHTVSDANYKFLVTHPASAYHNDETNWDSENTFNKINEILSDVHKTKINW